MRHWRSLVTLPCLLLSCGSKDGGSPPHNHRSWDGVVQVHGTLRAMFHEGQSAATVTLEAMLPNSDLYAVGALADLAGEITVVGGKVYLSYSEGETARTEMPSRPSAGAALLVASAVPAWSGVPTHHRIRFEELEAEIAALAAAMGMSLDTRFPFLIEGEVEDLQWHVIDGARLAAGGNSHEDHRAAAANAKLERASATLVGFYSRSDQGVFTHMGSNTHIHCVLGSPLASGHVDHVVIPEGTTVRFPTRGK
jgi:alpha-acetolactate decarboxylase